MQIIGAKEYPTLWVPNLCTVNSKTKITADIQTILSAKTQIQKKKINIIYVRIKTLHKRKKH